ncbi:MAG: hypothetical protein ABJQ66_08960, partial [Paracoccaceae bacterium]
MSVAAETLSVERALTTIEYVFFLDEDWAWNGLSIVLSVRLSEKHRMALATSVLASLSSQQMHHVSDMFQPASHCPLPPFLSATTEAKFWADSAFQEEIEAYLVACFRKLPDQRKKEFLDFATS